MSEYNEQNLEEEEDIVEIVQASKKKQKSWFFRLLRILFRTVFVLFLLLVVIRVLISVPSVQNKVVEWTTNSLEDKLGTRVEIESVHLDFFDDFDIEGIYLQDFHQDTIIYAEHLHIDIAFLSLFNRKIIIEDIELDNTRFNYYRYPGEYYTDLQKVLLALSQPYEPGPPSKNGTFYFDTDNIIINDLRFGFQNASNGDKLLIYLKSLSLDALKGDINTKTLDLNSIVLNTPRAEFVKAVRFDIPEENYPKRHPADTINYPIDSTQANSWTISVNELALQDGSFNFDDLKFKNFFNLDLDVRHFDFENINITVEDFLLKDSKATGNIVEGYLNEKRGFEVSEFTSKMMIREDTMAFYDLSLVTPESTVGDTVIFAYKHISDFGYFNDKVKMDIRSQNSTIAIKDIMVFAPKLNENAFFRQNKDGKLLLKGRVYDRVNRLKGDDLYISFGKNATAKGNFRSRNLTNPDETLLRLSIDRLNTNMGNIALLFPNIKINEQFRRLGKIYFQGNFDGFYYDFVADGSLKTDLGKADMSINFKSPTNIRRYSGKLNLSEFNLQEFTQRDDLGKVTFTSNIKGTGGNVESLDLIMDAEVQTFSYKNYTYENVDIDGEFKQKSFIGNMRFEDGNAELSFNGEVNFNDSLPKFDLSSEIAFLDLESVNLVNEPLSIQASVNLNFVGDDLDNIVGKASVRNYYMETRGESFYLDSAVLTSKIISDNQRSMNLSSEILTADLSGDFTVKNIEKPILNFIAKNYPSFAEQLSIKYNDEYEGYTSDQSDKFIFDGKIIDSKNFTYLLDPDLDTIKNLQFDADFDAQENLLKFALLVPKIEYRNIILNGISTRSDGISDSGEFTIQVVESQIGNLQIPRLTLENTLKRDTVLFRTSVSSFTDIFSSLNINGELFLKDNQFQVHLDSSDLFIADKKWAVSDENFIKFGKGYINTNNFNLTSGDQTISLNSVGDKGLKFDINNLPIDWLEEFFTIPFLDLGGKISATAYSMNIFKVTEVPLISTVFVDSAYINNQYFGALDIKATLPSFTKPMNFELALEALVLNDEDKLESQTLNVEGKYILPFTKVGTSFSERPNSFNIKAKANNFPFQVAEFFVPGISGSTGKFSADLLFTGDNKSPDAKGYLQITDAGTRIDYLQTYYRLDDVKINVGNNRFDFSGSELKDKFGNIAMVNGGINHTALKNFVLDIRINSPQFLLIDTEKEDNDLFYGRGIGAAAVDFSGPLSAPKIAINATTAKNTWMAIPLSGSSNAKAVNFINFVNPKDVETETDENVKISGVSIELELNVTPQAEISLILDESVGDVMKGRGKGNLKINLTNTGEFTMFGTYELTSGEYLFTYNDAILRINKPFVVRRGGTITWDGSPYTAQINIDAVYKGLRTSVYNLILENLTSDEEIVLAQRGTDVELQMSLTGELLTPQIDFDIDFPNLNQRLRVPVQQKMQTLQADKGELNRQVFGLIALKSFLPSEGVSTGVGTVVDAYTNTLSEMLSNQLSIYVTGLVSEIVTDVDFISGVDFDFNYSRYSDATSNDINTNAGVNDEFQINTQTRLFDNKWILSVGGSRENANDVSTGQTQNFITGDFVIEYVISDDGRLRMKAYNRTDPDILGYQNKTGVGLSYSIDFDSFKKKKATKKKEK